MDKRDIESTNDKLFRVAGSESNIIFVEDGQETLQPAHE